MNFFKGDANKALALFSRMRYPADSSDFAKAIHIFGVHSREKLIWVARGQIELEPSHFDFRGDKVCFFLFF